MDKKYSKEDILLIIIIVITGVVSFIIADAIDVRSRNVFMLMALLEFGIYCIVKWFGHNKEKETPARNNDADNTLMPNPMKERFDKVCNYCNQLEDAGYDTYEIFPPVSNNEIVSWEEKNQVILPENLKQWLLLSDGFGEIQSVTLYGLEGICKYPDEEYEGYYIIGSYVGNGSFMLIDKDGGFYQLDHDFGLKKSTFEAFIDNEVIFWLEDGMKEMGLL